MKTDFHNKDFALSLDLKWSLRSTRKWPISPLSSSTQLRPSNQALHICITTTEKHELKSSSNEVPNQYDTLTVAPEREIVAFLVYLQNMPGQSV